MTAAIAAGELDPARLSAPAQARGRAALGGRRASGRTAGRQGRTCSRAPHARHSPCSSRCLGAACAQARVALLATGHERGRAARRHHRPGGGTARAARAVARGRHHPRRAARVRRGGQRRRRLRPRDGPRGAESVPTHPAAPFAVLTRDLGAPAVGIAVSPGGASVYAAAGRRLYVLDAKTLAVRHRVRLRGTASALALSREGTLAAVVLTKGRVAMVATGAPKLLRRVKVKGATGARLRRRGPRVGQRAAAPVRGAPGGAQAREAPAAPRQGRGRRGGRLARRPDPGRRRRAWRRARGARRRRRAPRAPLPLRAAAPGRPAGRPTASASTTPTAAARRSRW